MLLWGGGSCRWDIGIMKPAQEILSLQGELKMRWLKKNTSPAPSQNFEFVELIKYNTTINAIDSGGPCIKLIL